MTSRRAFLTRSVPACLALPLAAAPKLKIVSVDAKPANFGQVVSSGTRKFSSEFDPARWRWRGPFAQLTGSILVTIQTDQGVTGHGLGGGGGAGAFIIQNHLSDFLMGSNPLDIERLWDQMFTSSSYYGRKGVAIMALSGVDLALWDIAGKVAGKPVYELLGGATKEKVPAYYTGTQIEKAQSLGFRAFKIPIFDGVAEGKEGMARTIARLTQVRKTIGADADLMIDCNSLWDVAYTLEMCDRLAGLRLRWVEEPLLPDDLEGYSRLCEMVRGPSIASGEHEYTRFGFGDLLRHRAAQILQPDITWSGGLTEIRRVVGMAAAASVPVVPHRGGSIYGMSLILSSPHCHLAESFGTLETSNDLMTAMTSRFENGFYYPNEAPGFGLRI